MFFQILTGLLLFLTLAHSAPQLTVRHEKHSPPAGSGWTKHAPAPADTRIPVRIALKQQNLDYGHDLLMDISYPDSPYYGKHLTANEVAELFAPSQGSIDAVTEWLSSSGISSDRYRITPSRQYIKFNASVGEVEELLQAKYHTYHHTETGGKQVACDEYYVPQVVHQHIDFITPTVHTAFEPLRAHIFKPRQTTISPRSKYRRSTKSVWNCNDGISPQCMRDAYGIPSKVEAPQNNSFAIYEWGDYWDPEDMDRFYNRFAPWVPSGTYPNPKPIDTETWKGNTSNAWIKGAESLLDFQIAIPLVYPQVVDLYQTGYKKEPGRGFLNNFLDALDSTYCGGDSKDDPPYPDNNEGGWNHPEMCGTYKPANVISISYGGDETGMPASYFQRQCEEFKKIALQGVSVIASSGDNGVSSISGNFCSRFVPLYPASCPYVTAVGATTLGDGGLHDRQVAVSETSRYPGYWSGGGFSDIFPHQEWQKEAVGGYLSSYANSTNTGMYNSSGRGYPDVAALGINIMTVQSTANVHMAGTSASAPLFASMITLINGERLKAGKSLVGFLNPTLYANKDAFTDVIQGHNPGCSTGGFNCSKGWDPVTGLGTPNYQKLLDAFMKLQ